MKQGKFIIIHNIPFLLIKKMEEFEEVSQFNNLWLIGDVIKFELVFIYNISDNEICYEYPDVIKNVNTKIPLTKCYLDLVLILYNNLTISALLGKADGIIIETKETLLDNSDHNAFQEIIAYDDIDINTLNINIKKYGKTDNISIKEITVDDIENTIIENLIKGIKGISLDN